MIQRLDALIAAYGADRRRWPADAVLDAQLIAWARADAVTSSAATPEAFAARALAAADGEAVTIPAVTIPARAIATATARPAAPRGWRGWAARGALAAAAVIAMTLAIPAPTPAPQAPPLRQAASAAPVPEADLVLYAALFTPTFEEEAL